MTHRDFRSQGRAFLVLVLAFQFASAALSACACDFNHDTIDTLALLNSTTGGRVRENVPFALPCFSEYNGQRVERDEQACSTVQANWASLAYRAGIPGSYMYTQDSMCLSNVHDQCVLDSKNPTNAMAYTGRGCNQGIVPTHYLEVRHPCDVKAAFQYSEASGQPLVVKNSGHDTMAHSSRRGALALWTRPLRKLAHHEAFVPQNAPGGDQTHAQMALTVGAGINCGEAYRYAQKHNFTVLCGYTPTVGMSGGWVQNGGHSVLSPVYGLGVDRVLEYKVVTPDGVYRTANAYQNQDLFWALRGGGGGTFGVVLESTHKIEPALPIVSVGLGFSSKNMNDALGFYNVLIEESEALGDLGWGGHITGTTAVYINPLLSLEDSKKSMRNMTQHVLEHGGHVDFKELASFSDWFEEVLTKGNATAGGAGFVASRLIPKATFQTHQGRQGLLQIITDYVESGGKFSLPIGPPTVFKQEKLNATSATPAWYSSLWHLTLRTGLSWNSTSEERKQAAARLNGFDSQMEALTPGGGAYMNEASPFTKDWRNAWWGEANYQSLLAIKKRYDAKRLLLCRKCIGWDDSDDEDSCFSVF